jgi:23S rRNA C2498 (ribose-2'-O)-methylase RlmM
METASANAIVDVRKVPARIKNKANNTWRLEHLFNIAAPMKRKYNFIELKNQLL